MLSHYPIHECNYLCNCGPNCVNRVCPADSVCSINVCPSGRTEWQESQHQHQEGMVLPSTSWRALTLALYRRWTKGGACLRATSRSRRGRISASTQASSSRTPRRKSGGGQSVFHEPRQGCSRRRSETVRQVWADVPAGSRLALYQAGAHGDARRRGPHVGSVQHRRVPRRQRTSAPALVFV